MFQLGSSRRSFLQWNKPSEIWYSPGPYTPAITIVVFYRFQSLLYLLLRRANVNILGSTPSRTPTPTKMAILDQDCCWSRCDSCVSFWFLFTRWKSNFDSSSPVSLISFSQHMADIKERRNPRNTLLFMTRSDSSPMNSRTLRMPSVTCFLEQRRLWAWLHRHSMWILHKLLQGFPSGYRFFRQRQRRGCLAWSSRVLACWRRWAHVEGHCFISNR